MNSTERFIALLEEREIVSSRTAESLRAQVAESRKPISPESIAKRLIKSGRLTSSQAKRLLSSLTDESSKTPPESKPKTGSKPKVEPKPAADDDLGFAPIDDEPDKSKRAAKRREERPAPRPQAEQPAKQPSAPAPAKPARRESLLDQEMPAAPVGGGPLDNLMADAVMSAAAASSPLDKSSSKGKGKGWFRLFRRKPEKIKTGEEQWGSSLMLAGGGGLLLLLILGGVLVWTLTRSSGDEMLRLADEDYRNGSYAQAINKYEKFLKQFPNHAGASIANVRIGLAQLRQATSAGNWSAALKTSQEVLDRIASEKDFKEAHRELASMLPTIAEGLAAAALKKTSQQLVDETRLALKNAGNPGYVPKSLRQESKLAEVEGKLALTVRNIAQSNELDKTIAAMLAAAKAGKTPDAYAACNALLRQYPKLVDDPKLKQALLEVSKAQQSMVKLVSTPKPAEAAAQPNPAFDGAATLAQNELKTKVPDTEGQIALAAVDGTVYGLNAADGKLLWRRFVGFPTDPRAPAFPPTLLGPEPGSDALVVDSGKNELLRLEAASGNVRWRQSIGEPFDADPVIAGNKIYLAARSGKLYTVDAAGGESPSHVLFPQELTVAPALDTRRSLMFQVAVHSNIYVLSTADGACRDVIYLGHGSGSVNTAPVIVGDFLLLAVNDGARDCVLKLFLIQPSTSSDKPKPWLKPVQQIRLGGHVKAPPLVDGRRVLVATASGLVRVYEISATDVKMPLREIGDTAVDGGDNLIRFPLLRSGRFWIADTRLTKYDVQAAAGKLSPKWIADQEGVFLQPPAVVGEAIICVQRRPGMPGAVVSAVSTIDPNQYWKTQIGCPLAGRPHIATDGNKVVAVTAAGAVFRFDAGRRGATIINEPIVSADVTRLKRPIKFAVPLADGFLAVSGGKGSKSIGIFDPRAASPLMSWPELPDELACAPVALGRGLLVADRAGRVSLLDPNPNSQSSGKLADPFQPRLEPGEKVEWLAPAVVNDREIVIADGKGKIYRLGIKDQSKPHLEPLAQTTVAKPIVSPLAAAGKSVFGADAGNMLAEFDLEKLARGKEVDIGAHCEWGPAAIGGNVLLATEDNMLFCLDGAGKQLWRAELKHGPLAGEPLPVGDNYILVARDGHVLRLDAAGKEIGQLDVGYPLATGAASIGQRLLIGGLDGTVYEVRQP